MMSLRDEVTNDPLGIGYAGMSKTEIETALNAKTRTRLVEKRIGYGAVMVALGAEAGAAVLDALDMASSVSSPLKWAMKLLAADNLDIGNPQTRGQVDHLAAAGVMTAAQAAVLKSLADQPCSRAEEIGVGHVTAEILWNEGVR